MLRTSRPPLTYQRGTGELAPAEVDLHREGANVRMLEHHDRPPVGQRLFVEEADAVAARCLCRPRSSPGRPAAGPSGRAASRAATAATESARTRGARISPVAAAHGAACETLRSILPFVAALSSEYGGRPSASVSWAVKKSVAEILIERKFSQWCVQWAQPEPGRKSRGESCRKDGGAVDKAGNLRCPKRLQGNRYTTVGHGRTPRKRFFTRSPRRASHPSTTTVKRRTAGGRWEGEAPARLSSPKSAEPNSSRTSFSRVGNTLMKDWFRV